MRDSGTPFFVGLDIGTHTTRCVVGTVDQEDPSKLSIMGHGSAPNIGMRKGVVVHVEDVADSIVHAIAEAERLSGNRITKATVNINGAHVTGLNSKGVIAISAANREITNEDRMRVEEAATVVQLPANKEIIQVFAKNYRLDGQDNIKDPVGMRGVRLEVDTHIVTASLPNVRNLDLALEKAQVRPVNKTLSSLASAEAVLTRQQKEAGALVIDMGAGTTNITVIEDGEVQHVAVLPIGGINITNDLAIGLRTDLEVAEAVKVKHAGLSGAGSKRTNVSVKVGDQEYTFAMDDILMITEARVDEMFEYIDKELQRIRKSRKLPGGVVLVGGTAKLPGIDVFAKERLQLSVHIGKPHGMLGLIDNVADPSFAAAVGLAMLDMLLVDANDNVETVSQSTKMLNIVDNLFSRFRT